MLRTARSLVHGSTAIVTVLLFAILNAGASAQTEPPERYRLYDGQNFKPCQPLLRAANEAAQGRPTLSNDWRYSGLLSKADLLSVSGFSDATWRLLDTRESKGLLRKIVTREPHRAPYYAEFFDPGSNKHPRFDAWRQVPKWEQLTEKDKTELSEFVQGAFQNFVRSGGQVKSFVPSVPSPNTVVQFERKIRNASAPASQGSPWVELDPVAIVSVSQESDKSLSPTNSMMLGERLLLYRHSSDKQQVVTVEQGAVALRARFGGWLCVIGEK